MRATAAAAAVREMKSEEGIEWENLNTYPHTVVQKGGGGGKMRVNDRQRMQDTFKSEMNTKLESYLSQIYLSIVCECMCI
jgi:hypothetical protein